MPESWTNWSGGVTANPVRIERPASEAELRASIKRANADGLSVRVVGSAHSFTPIVATDGVIISLDEMAGLVQTDPAKNTATLWGGTKLNIATHLLWEAGLGLFNQGDIDVQSVAGAIGTGTHGTGVSYGNIPSKVVGMRLVTAAGEIFDTDGADPEILRAARVSLGLLGVTSQVTITCLPRYAFRERVWRIPGNECLAQLDALIANNDHFEFFWYPPTDTAECKSLNPVPDAPVEELPAPMDGPGERIGWSHAIFPSIRNNKFNEMEYSVPAEEGRECFEEVRDCMRAKFPEWVWPLEYRTLAADDAMISTAHNRETVTISVHQDARRPYEPYFREVEEIFIAHRGRPHWGKIHWRDRAFFEREYPEWENFLRIRREMDPGGVFLSPALRPIFE